MSVESDYRHTVVGCGKPVFRDLDPLPWFDAGKMNVEARQRAGQDALVSAQLREDGRHDISVLSRGPAEETSQHLLRFYEEIGMPRSPIIQWGFGTGEPPEGYLVETRSFDKRYHRPGEKNDLWRKTIGKTRDKADFQKVCENAGFGYMLPKSWRFPAGKRPTASQIAEMFKHFRMVVIKITREVWGDHPMGFCDTPAKVQEFIDTEVSESDGLLIEEFVPGVACNIAFSRGVDGRLILDYALRQILVNKKEFCGGVSRVGFRKKIGDFIRPLAEFILSLGLDRFGVGVMYDEESGRLVVIDFNGRMNGSQPARDLLRQINAGAGDDVEVILGFHYQLMVGSPLRGWDLCKAVLDGPHRPNPKNGRGLWLVNPGGLLEGSAGWAGFGELRSEEIMAGMGHLGMRLPSGH